VASRRSRIPKSPSTRFHTYGLALNKLIGGIFAASIPARVLTAATPPARQTVTLPTSDASRGLSRSSLRPPARGGGVAGQLATRTLGMSARISPCSADGCAWTSPDLAAALDLDLVVADRARHPPARLDQEALADHQIAFETALDLGFLQP
jgi:hypothetical protein